MSLVRTDSLRTNHSNNRSTLFILARMASFLWVIAVGPLAVLLAFVANTGRGRLFAAMALLAAILPQMATIAARKRVARWTSGVIGLSVCWLALAVAVLALTPTGGARGGHRVLHAFAATTQEFPRYSLGNLLPEGDQLRLGFSLMPMIDPLFTTVQSSELKGLTASIYEELESDPDFHELGSVMSGPYGELLGHAWVKGHSYVYLPKVADTNRPLPVLVFFHGSGGNFKAYLWILSKLADKSGFALVAPSNGLGNWTEESSVKGLDDALTAVSQVAVVDRSRVHVAGLSNGGLAISHLAETRGSHLASMIFLSPVFFTPSIDSASFVTQCAGRRVLVLTGSKDDRVPLSYMEENSGRMKRSGARVTLKSFDGANHFLLFSHRDALRPILEEWLGSEK